jgi:GAF domain
MREVPAYSDYRATRAVLISVQRELQSIGTDLDRALRLIAGRAQTLTRASGAAIALVSAEPFLCPRSANPGSANPGSVNDEMTCRASAGADAPGLGARLKVGSGFSGECVRSGMLLRCDDSESDARVDRQNCRMLGIRSMIAVPVKDSECVLGILEVFSPRPKAFSEADNPTLLGLAELVASVIAPAQRAAAPSEIAHEVDEGQGLSSSNLNAHLKAAPDLQLLLELEPAHRVFLRNLTDTLSRRSAPPVATASRPAPFWGDVFVYSGMPWWSFLGSMIWHMLAVVAVWGLSQVWAQREPPPPWRILHKSYVTYYAPSQSFPALGSNQSRLRAWSKRRRESADQPVISVARERTHSIIAPPDRKLTEPGQPNIAGSNLALPMMPLSATRRSQLTVPLGPTSVVGPPPDLGHATARSSGLPQASVVAPPPDVGSVSVFTRRAVTAPSAIVVAPPPTMPFSTRRAGDINIGHSEVVGPAPRLPTYEQHIGGTAPATLGGLATSVVPPPPSAQRPGTLADGRASGLSNGALQAVPPPPSLGVAGNAMGGGRASSLSNDASQALPSPPSVQGGGNSAANGSLMARDNRPAVPAPPPSVVDNPNAPATQELPVRLIGIALALPSSSYFSNYEVFIAERRLSKYVSQLIKLVYISLPYQRRLSEYGLKNSKVFKLRVTRDPTCDETLLQMTWPQTAESQPNSQYSTDPPASIPNKGNSMLPCYRTTADDYRKALSQSH